MNAAVKPSRKVRVLVVDDSAVMRKMIAALLSLDEDIEVVGSAPDAIIARDKLVQLQPDVMTLDIEMPRIDGLTFLEKVMEYMPTRTLILSSLTQAGSREALKALSLGAVDVMPKPVGDLSTGMDAMSQELRERVKAVSQARILPQRKERASLVKKIPPLTMPTTDQILAIGASTGGTQALKEMMADLPAEIPPTIIVQHMPPVFTKTFSSSLNQICPFEVREAEEGDYLMPGLALVAPGNFHLELQRRGRLYQVRLHQEPLLHGVRPAIDYTMRSVARAAGSKAMGVILTGMGKDGAEGLLAMRDAGAVTVAQDEASSVVYGMPKVAAEIGAAQSIVPLDGIAQRVKRWMGSA